MGDLERSDYAFWLPTSTDRFYSDFVAAHSHSGALRDKAAKTREDFT